MSRTDKDVPFDVHQRRAGRRHEHNPTCALSSPERTISIRALFYAHEVAEQRQFTDTARDLGFAIGRTERRGYISTIPEGSPYEDLLSDGESDEARLRRFGSYPELRALAPLDRHLWSTPPKYRARLVTFYGRSWTALRPASAKPNIFVSLVAEKRIPARPTKCWDERGWGPAKDRTKGGYDLPADDPRAYGSHCSCCSPRRHRDTPKRALLHAELQASTAKPDPGVTAIEAALEAQTGPPHVFVAGRCIHCWCDDHSLPAPGELLSEDMKACPYDLPDRITLWAFGPTDDEPPAMAAALAEAGLAA